MCGLAGIAARVGCPDKMRLAAAVHALVHRGPDGRGLRIVNNVGLAHVRLAVVGRSTDAAQPAGYQGGWLVYNGEIYNFRELAARYCLPAIAHRSDTHALLHGLLRVGVDFLNDIEGMFAFAFYDSADGCLTLARDRFGIKPIYLEVGGDSFAFASSQVALLQVRGECRKETTRHRLLECLEQRWLAGRSTMLRGVERVLPGEVVSLDTRSWEVRRSRWWRVRDVVTPARLRARRLRSRAGLARELESVLRDAVARRLEADCDVGTLCSGGLDSGLVTAFARQTGRQYPAYNVAIAGQPRWNEHDYASGLCHALGVDLRTTWLTPKRFCAAVVPAVIAFEYPLVHESSVALGALAEDARRDGVKVLLGGDGADELFGGYESRAVQARLVFEHGHPVLQSSERKFVARRFGPAWCYERAIMDEAKHAYRFLPPAHAALQGALAADLSLFLIHALTRADKNLMQGGVEYREPFLDDAVVELAMNLPLEMKLRPRLKGILLDVAQRHLPSAVVDRTKVGFSFEPDLWLGPKLAPRFLMRARIREALQMKKASWARLVGTPGGRWWFRLVSAEVWYRYFVLGEDEEAIEADLYMNAAKQRKALAP